MENNTSAPQPTKSFPLKRVIFLSLAGVIAVALVVFLVFFVHTFLLEHEVETALEKVPSAIEQATPSGNGYSTTLPSGITSDDQVVLTGGGSFDGTTYCVTGVSKKDSSITYYIESTKKTPEKGSCQSAADAATPTSTGAPAISFVGTSQIQASWVATPYATSYTLQCASDTAFAKNIVTVTSQTPSGECDGLNSGTSYYLRVRAENKTDGPWSSTVQGKTSAVSTPPAALTLKATSSTKIDYSWGSVDGAKSYVIEWATDVNFMNDEQSVTQTKTSGTSTGLKPGTVYWYHVKTITDEFDATHATFSPEIQVTTPK